MAMRVYEVVTGNARVQLKRQVAPTDLVNPDAHQWLALQWKTVVSATSLAI